MRRSGIHILSQDSSAAGTPGYASGVQRSTEPDHGEKGHQRLTNSHYCEASVLRPGAQVWAFFASILAFELQQLSDEITMAMCPRRRVSIFFIHRLFVLHEVCFRTVVTLAFPDIYGDMRGVGCLILLRPAVGEARSESPS